MKINGTLFTMFLILWIVVGIIVFDAIIPMLVFIICGGVVGGLILAKERSKTSH